MYKTIDTIGAPGSYNEIYYIHRKVNVSVKDKNGIRVREIVTPKESLSYSVFELRDGDLLIVTNPRSTEIPLVRPRSLRIKEYAVCFESTINLPWDTSTTELLWKGRVFVNFFVLGRNRQESTRRLKGRGSHLSRCDIFTNGKDILLIDPRMCRQ